MDRFLLVVGEPSSSHPVCARPVRLTVGLCWNFAAEGFDAASLSRGFGFIRNRFALA